MLITVSLLYRDMLNFFRNKYFDFILLALLTAIISTILNYFLLSQYEQLFSIKNTPNISYIKQTNILNIRQMIELLSIDQQKNLIKAYIAGNFSGLIGNVILYGGSLTMIKIISNKKSINVIDAMIKSLPILPRLLLLVFITTFLIQLGLILIIPGILFAIAFSLTPIILINKHLNIINSIYISIKLAYSNILLIGPAVLLCFLLKTAILLLLMQFSIISKFINSIIFNGVNNIISILFLIYLYRLYILLYQKT